MITVLIPSAKRPDMLRNALRSISEQTAVQEISEVIVSESAGDSRSREVCKEFSSLPVKYIFREPQMLMAEHFYSLKSAHWAGDLTVMLHDDDWWTPDFISTALAAFRSNPEAVSYCCNSFYAMNESEISQCVFSFYFWFGANYPNMQSIWKLNQREVLLASILHTPAHYSTIMARADVFRNSSIVYETGNTWDLDRMFICELSRQGTLLYSPIPKAFYRTHAQQLTNSFSLSEREKQMCSTTEWMIKRCGETMESAGILFYLRAMSCPKSKLGTLDYLALKAWALPLLANNQSKASDISKLYMPMLKRNKRKALIKRFIPSILIETGKSLRDLFRK